MEDEPWVLCWTKVGQLVLDRFNRKKVGVSLGIKEPTTVVVYMVYINSPGWECTEWKRLSTL